MKIFAIYLEIERSEKGVRFRYLTPEDVANGARYTGVDKLNDHYGAGILRRHPEIALFETKDAALEAIKDARRRKPDNGSK